MLYTKLIYQSTKISPYLIGDEIIQGGKIYLFQRLFNLFSDDLPDNS